MIALEEFGFGALLFLIALVEVLPPAGRYLPGPLLVCAIAGLAAWRDAFAWWQLLGAGLGAIAGDIANYERARRHPRRTWARSTDWGLDTPEARGIERALQASPWRVALTRKLLTRDRALLPLVAGAWGAPWRPFLAVTVCTSLAWGLVWAGLGAGGILALKVLPPLWSMGILVVVALLVVPPYARADQSAQWV